MSIYFTLMLSTHLIIIKVVFFHIYSLLACDNINLSIWNMLFQPLWKNKFVHLEIWGDSSSMFGITLIVMWCEVNIKMLQLEYYSFTSTHCWLMIIKIFDMIYAASTVVKNIVHFKIWWDLSITRGITLIVIWCEVDESTLDIYFFLFGGKKLYFFLKYLRLTLILKVWFFWIAPW